MNDDLISRTSLLRNIGRYGASIDPYNITRLITQKILAEPEVDAEPVRHGKWRECGYADIWRCTKCNKYFGHHGNYCPNCGAKMDGDEDAAD